MTREEAENKLGDKEILSNVLINDEALLLFLGKWLGVVDSHVLESDISKATRVEISKKIRQILQQVGLSGRCLLDQFDAANYSFKCYDFYSDRYVDVIVCPNDWNKTGYSLQVDFGNEKKGYAFSGYSVDPAPILALSEYTKRDKLGKISFYRKLSTCSYFAIVKDGAYELSIFLEVPNDGREGNYYLENESDLENYLLGLTFPISIEDVYRKLNVDKSSFSRINLRAIRQDDEKKIMVTDVISISDGKVLTFAITRGAKTVFLDGNHWTFIDRTTGDEMITISQNTIDGNVDFHMENIHSSAIPQEVFVQEHVSTAYKEVQMMRELKKNVLGE